MVLQKIIQQSRAHLYTRLILNLSYIDEAEELSEPVSMCWPESGGIFTSGYFLSVSIVSGGIVLGVMHFRFKSEYIYRYLEQ